MKRWRFLSLVLCMLLALAGCSAPAATEKQQSQSTKTESTTTTPMKVVSAKYDSDDYYYDWKSASHKTINLQGGSITADGAGMAVQGPVVTILASGVYEITGTLTDGSIVVAVDKSADKKTVFLVLNGANITSKTSAPIYVKDAKKVVLLIENGTENSVTGEAGCIVNANEEPSAAIFSKADLTIAGGGTLRVRGDYNDGITSKDDLRITGGTLIIDAKADGIVGKDSLNIADANITINAGKDGMRSTNEVDAGKGNVVIQKGQFKITAANDAIQAYNLLQIDDGAFLLSSGGGYPGRSISGGNNRFGPPGPPGQPVATTNDTSDTEESKKGLKAGRSILINGGTIDVSSYEDAVHSNGDITIGGGSLTVQSGDDAVHAENAIAISGGDLTVKNSYEGLEGTQIAFSGGKTYVTSSDDAINVNANQGTLNITGGEILLNSNGDGLDCNGNVYMSGGTVYVDGPLANDNGAIDYNGSFTISGGTLVASGSSGMAEAPGANSTQPSILMYYGSAQAAGTTISLRDANGNVTVSFSPSKQYNSVAISSPKLSVGSTYALFGGDKKIVDITLSSTVAYFSESGAVTGPQNRGPGAGRRPQGRPVGPR